MCYELKISPDLNLQNISEIYYFVTKIESMLSQFPQYIATNPSVIYIGY